MNIFYQSEHFRIVENHGDSLECQYKGRRWPGKNSTAKEFVIEKWQLIVEAMEGELSKEPWLQHRVAPGGTSTCAYCHLYYNEDDDENRCSGCPVANAGYWGCNNSPYTNLVRTFNPEERLAYAKEVLQLAINVPAED